MNLRHLLCDPKDGQGKLSEDYSEEEVSTVHSDHQIVHLSWNTVGTDIAIVDVFGQISIFTVQIPLNRIRVSRKCVMDPEDNLSAVVGLKWLNTDRVVHSNRQSLKASADILASVVPSGLQERWDVALHGFPAQPHGATESTWSQICPSGGDERGRDTASGAGARITVARHKDRGRQRLVILGTALACGFECRQRLAAVMELNTGADRAWSDSTMLLVTHSIDKQLRLYRVSIDFQQFVFNIQHLKTINDCFPMDQESNNLLMSRKMSCQMSHLELIAPGPEIRNRAPTAPFVLAVFSYVPDHSQDDAIREPFSILSRWELHGAKAKLHPSFEQLTSKRPNVSSTGELPVCLTSSMYRVVLIPLISQKFPLRD